MDIKVEETKMNICHLYYETSTSLQAKGLVDSFENSLSMDINAIESLEDYSIFIVELNKIDKVITERVKELFKNRSNSLIYFAVSEKCNLMLFQLAFLLKAKTIITSSQDIGRLILKLKSDFKLYEDEYLQLLLSQTLFPTEYFLFLKNEQLIFASEKFLQDFGCRNLDEVEKKVFSQFDIKELLPEEGSVFKELSLEDGRGLSFNIRSSTPNQKDEKFIFFNPHVEHKSSEDRLNFVSSRISFIELLKDKLIEKSISSKTFSMMTIAIENLKKLENDLNKLEIEIFLKDFLLLVDKTIDEKIILAQYDSDLYIVLYEDIEEENLKSKAENFQHQISAYLGELKFTPYIELFAFNTAALDLNKILLILESISDKTISQDQITHNSIKYVANVDGKMDDESETIKHLLRNIYANKSEIKLLNIYKGLCINTAATIVKNNDETIYVHFQQLQGMVMKYEKETVLQSSSFPKDIRARVKYVNLEKKLAILENFSFLDANANARRYSRVTCSNRTPIVISHLGSTLSGEIIDISISSIAVKVKYVKAIDTLKDRVVKLSFVLPSKSSEEGYIKVSVEAKVYFVFCAEGSCKIVCELIKDDSNESMLMEYVYDRQKDIITEVKKIAREF